MRHFLPLTIIYGIAFLAIERYGQAPHDPASIGPLLIFNPTAALTISALHATIAGFTPWVAPAVALGYLGAEYIYYQSVTPIFTIPYAICALSGSALGHLIYRHRKRTTKAHPTQ
ncbi:hypothetical protein [Corynebacterium aquilae]|uniref:Uncharacterized protein n=1 Tax=Corynebacterium aquilae DSM 44791 TaxID=1431546 RepID=A0A1L7CDG5_9CORY|nr:hypothetical protein [Corynebacterium aquilae]APT83885.1 hypothetical protein CAQU_00980 [Corynebacterium aquilae DSM 44791]